MQTIAAPSSGSLIETVVVAVAAVVYPGGRVARREGRRDGG